MAFSGNRNDKPDLAIITGAEEGSTGIEEESVGPEDAITEPFYPTLIRVATNALTIDLLTTRLREKEIELAPDFQRRRSRPDPLEFPSSQIVDGCLSAWTELRASQGRAVMPAARDRQRYVLEQMVRTGSITAQEAEDAARQPIRLVEAETRTVLVTAPGLFG